MTQIRTPPFQAQVVDQDWKLTREFHAWISYLFNYLQLGSYKDGNYIEFDNEGFLSFNGNARFEKELTVYDSNAKLPASGAPTWTSYKGGEVLAYSPTQDNKINFIVELPHEYATGTDVTMHLHYVTPTANTGDVRWEFTYSYANIDDIFPAETTVSTALAVTGAVDKHQLADHLFTFTGPGREYGGIAICSLTRTGTHVDDTFPDDIYNLSVVFHVICDKLGTKIP